MALVPLLLFVAFVLWRGWLLPVLAPDAHVYHMPKALLPAKEAGYRFFSHPDHRVSYYPFNYELLLADMLVLDRSDRITEWLSTLSYIWFVLQSAALAERFWGGGPHILVVALLSGSAPVLLLHAGTHKNDLLMSNLVLASSMWTARWAVDGEHIAGVLGAVAVGMALGTKPSGALVAVALVPVALWALWRRRAAGHRALRVLATPALVGLLGWPLLGMIIIPVNLWLGRSLWGTPPEGAAAYGCWHQLWEFPYLLLTKPFSSRGDAVWVPWKGEFWWWTDYDLHQSHLGCAMSLLACCVPFCVWRYRSAASHSLGGENQAA